MPTILLRRRDIFYNYQSHQTALVLSSKKKYLPHCYFQLFILFFFAEEKKQSFRKDLSTIDPLELNLNRLIDSLSLLSLFLSQWTKRKFDNINRDCLDTVPPQ